MQAKETTLKPIIEGTNQYVVPLFQRTYCWTNAEWKTLWEDLFDLCDEDCQRTHFVGSIVSMPTKSVPEGVSKYLLIDGQQRLTTVFVILTVLRDMARERDGADSRFAEKIEQKFLLNSFEDGLDRYKLMPTQGDRETYCSLVDGRDCDKAKQIAKAYWYFHRQFRREKVDPEKITSVIMSRLSLVSIVLDPDDSPYLVFESLNAKGRLLTQADLIRNYFFMRIHASEQVRVYEETWRPMQESLKENLTEYIRHYLMKGGKIIKKDDVYNALRAEVSATNTLDYMRDMNRFAEYYQKMKCPDTEHDPSLRRAFSRLARIDVTTAFPLLLNFYGAYDNRLLDRKSFLAILSTLETFLIRRFVCNYPSNALRKLFGPIFSQIQKQYPADYVAGFKALLSQSKRCPKDLEFYSCFQDVGFEGTENTVRAKLILEIIESSYKHKEEVPFGNLEVEHIMPQTLSDPWKEHLGEDWEDTHDSRLHTIGNLTLTAYNPELSNKAFAKKKEILCESHLQINSYFSNIARWTSAEIDERGKELAAKALEIWPNFGGTQSSEKDPSRVKRGRPARFTILGKDVTVKSWRDVMVGFLNAIADLEPEKFETIADGFPRYVHREEREVTPPHVKLENGYYANVTLSAEAIERFCHRAMEAVGITADEYSVTCEQSEPEWESAPPSAHSPLFQ